MKKGQKIVCAITGIGLMIMATLLTDLQTQFNETSTLLFVIGAAIVLAPFKE